MERDAGLCCYGGGQRVGRISERNRRKWRQIPVDPAGERGAFRMLYPVSEVETAIAFAGTFSGMSDRCQRSVERGDGQSGTERRLSGDHRRCMGRRNRRSPSEGNRSVPDRTKRCTEEEKR